jgi:hypothetical protein
MSHVDPHASPEPEPIDKDIIDLTMSYLVAPHVLSRMQYIPEPIDYVTHKARIIELVEAVFVAGAADGEAPVGMPQSLFSRCSEFIRECNDYYRQLDRHGQAMSGHCTDATDD